MENISDRVRARIDFVLPHMKRGNLGLEIGASYNPVFSRERARSFGFEVRLLDRLTKNELKQEYAQINNTQLDLIEDVDYIWKGEPYREIVGDTRFDWIIASNVIEHTPDMIGFLKDCDNILNPDGFIFLVVPDPRRSRDYYRPCTPISTLIDAHTQQRCIPTLGNIIENRSMFAHVQGSKGLSWDYSAKGKILFDNRLPLDYFYKAKADVEAGVFRNCHVWNFTPLYFRFILEELYYFQLQPFREIDFSDGLGSDFFLIISKNAPGPELSRDRLGEMYVAEYGNRSNRQISSNNPSVSNKMEWHKELDDLIEKVRRSFVKNKQFVTHSIEGEDVILSKFFGRIKKGFYVDVGSSHPIRHSVTKHFYDLGWRGINIDPHVESMHLCKKNRKDDINICKAVSNKEGFFDYWKSDGSDLSTGVSTMDFETVKRLGEDAYQKITVETTTLNKILQDCESSDIHFLKIDVECHEKYVLMGLDLNIFRPWIIVVESTLPHSQVPTHGEWEYLLTESSYELITKHGVNRYYVAKEKKDELVSAFFDNPYTQCIHRIQNNALDSLLEFLQFTEF